MKDWKKCTAFLLALVICLGLAACGVGSSEGEREDYYTPGVIEDTDYDFTDDNPAEQLGYDSIEDMRTQEHEIISSDDNDNTVAEGYWYPDGDRSSSLYFMVQRDTIYWYEFNPGQGDVQVGEPDGIVLKLGNKRRLQSGQTFQYTTYELQQNLFRGRHNRIFLEGALKGIPVVKEESYMEQRYISKVKPLSQYILQVDFVSDSRLLLDMKLLCLCP